MKLSEREWTVLNALWEVEGAELGTLVNYLLPLTGWNRNTVLTYLTRMEKKELARLLGVSETLIGLTIVAIGTSLPELVTSVVAAKKGQTEIAMGNVIGSNLFNILCILGISAFIKPITVEATAIFDTLFLVAVSFFFWILCKWKPMDRKMGIFMVLTYIGYTIYIIMR